MAKKRQVFKKYSPEFKLSVIIDMRTNRLSYSETMRKYFPLCLEEEIQSIYLSSKNTYGYRRIELALRSKGMSPIQYRTHHHESI